MTRTPPPSELDVDLGVGAPVLAHVQPDGLFPSGRMGFSQVVVAAAERQVWVAGQTACDRAGRPVGGSSVGLQASVALDNVGVALREVGASPADVTFIRVYIVDMTRDLAEEVARRVAAFFEGCQPPASTWLGVQSLMHPDFLIEIDIVAALRMSETAGGSG